MQMPDGWLVRQVAGSAGVDGAQGVGCPVGRLLTLPLACFLSPIPPPALAERSFPPGKGESQSLFRRGLRPRHPCAKPGRTGAGGESRTRQGACLLCRLPNPAFSVLFCPYPPAPFPSGEGGSPKDYFAGGFAPGTPALNRLRHLQFLPCGHPAQGACGAAQNRQETAPYEQCRQPRRGGTGERNFGV